jgi:hypothetical protein
MANNEYRRRYTLIYSSYFSTCEQVKTFQMRGARRFAERRRTGRVRWSETNKRNEADGKFSPAQSFHSVLGQHLVDEAALIEFL